MDTAAALFPPRQELVEKPIATVLVVDDTPDNLTLMSALLREHYHVKVANQGEKALKIARTAAGAPDLILLDIMMPGMDGYEVCRQLKADAQTRHIPVIFLTARADIDDECQGLQLGAVDYITKPIVAPIVLARVATHLALKASSDFLRSKSAYLEREVALRTLEVQAIQDVTHDLAGRNARPGNGQPHPPHSALRQGPGRAPARAPALCPCAHRPHDRFALQIRPAARHWQDRHS